MKRFTVAVVLNLIIIPSLTFGSSHSIAHATMPRAKTVPLESLPITNNNGVATLSSTHPGHYQQSAIERGIQFTLEGQHITFQLDKKFAKLSGTIYEDDSAGNNSNDISVSDVSDPANPHVLTDLVVSKGEEKAFTINVRGVASLSLAYKQYLGLADIVADLTPLATPSQGPKSSTQVVSRYPTGNAAVAAESMVPFAWQPFPGAANYVFHVWMVGQGATTNLTPSTPLTFATGVYHTRGTTTASFPAPTSTHCSRWTPRVRRWPGGVPPFRLPSPVRKEAHL